MFGKGNRLTFFDQPAELARKERRPGPGQHTQQRFADNKQMIDYSQRLGSVRNSNDYMSEAG